MKARFFKSAGDFRAWLASHHDTERELLVGFYRKGSGKPSLTWPESVDEALCFGWIDGVRRSLGEDRYTIRFTPRRRSSIWSAINTRRVEVLTRQGRMHPSGLNAFAGRDPAKTNLYSFERETAVIPPEYERRLRANANAWAYWTAAPPYYKRVVAHWITTAKRDETKARRLAQVIESCARGERISAFNPKRTTSPARSARRTAFRQRP